MLAYSPVAQPRAGRANQNPCEVVPLYEGLVTGSSMLWQLTNGKLGPMGSRSLSAMGTSSPSIFKEVCVMGTTALQPELPSDSESLLY